MVALGAQVVAVGPSGERVIPIDKFFLGLFTTALQPDEILTEIRVPSPPPRSGGAYVKLERKVGDYATAAAAAQVTLGANGAFDRVGLALTNVGPTPVRSQEAQDVLLGRGPRTRRWRRPRAAPRRQARPRPTGGGRSSTSATWRACWRRGP